MPKKNIYSGNCLFCNKYTKRKEGYIKMKNPQRDDNINKKRKEERRWGVLCKDCFNKYAKMMKSKYHNYT